MLLSLGTSKKSLLVIGVVITYWCKNTTYMCNAKSVGFDVNATFYISENVSIELQIQGQNYKTNRWKIKI
jgi:hypothetical protein